MRIVDEIYCNVVKSVEEEIELPADWITSKKEICTDARSILIHYLHEAGLTRSQIESKTGLSKTAVRHHINSYQQRCSNNRMMSQYSKQIGRRLGETTVAKR